MHRGPDISEHWSGQAVGHLLAGSGHRPVFAHFGRVDHTVVERLLAEAESASLSVGDAVSVRKRLFNVLVEGLENVRVHAGEQFEDTAFALLVDAGDGYRLAFGNALPLAMAAMLSHRMEVLNSMEEADLKQHFMLMLGNDARTERGGAGLGLLTMARKSHRPMLVRTLPLNEGTAYFVMELAVLRS